MGEETYLGAVQDLSAYSGFNRVKLEWYLNADPRISSCVITWEGNENPVVVPVPENRVIKDPISTIIDLPEGKYIFNMITRSDTGKESLVRTIAGEVYGSTYQASLSAQGINSISADLNGVTINWVPLEGCTGTTLTYTNNEGKEKIIKVDEGQTSTVIPDAVLIIPFQKKIGMRFTNNMLMQTERIGESRLRQKKRLEKMLVNMVLPPVSLTEILPVSGTHNGKVKGLILHCHMKSLLI